MKWIVIFKRGKLASICMGPFETQTDAETFVGRKIASAGNLTGYDLFPMYSPDVEVIV